MIAEGQCRRVKLSNITIRSNIVNWKCLPDILNKYVQKMSSNFHTAKTEA